MALALRAVLAGLGALVGATCTWVVWGASSPGDYFAGGSAWVLPTVAAAAFAGAWAGARARSRAARGALGAASLLCVLFWLIVRDGWWAKPPPRAGAPVGDARSSGPPEPLEVKTDIAALGALVRLPAGATACRWVRRQRGDGLFGPSDFFVSAYVELSSAGWAELLGGDAGDGATRDPSPPRLPLRADLAALLLPERVLAGVPEPGPLVLLPSQPLPTERIQSKSVFRVSSVRRIGDGLWIELMTQ